MNYIKINESSFVNPVTLATEPVPIGGTIQEQIGWEASVTTGITFDFALMNNYGHGTDLANFVSSGFGGFAYRSVTGPWTPTDGSFTDPIDTVIPDVPLGVYDCLTFVGYVEGVDFYFYHGVINVGAITVEVPIGATIINTSFTRIA